MKVGELIDKLQELKDQEGDLEVLVTDGFDARCYLGAYAINVFEDCDDDETRFIDVGIGGLAEWE